MKNFSLFLFICLATTTSMLAMRVFAGKPMENSRTLQDYNMQSEPPLHLLGQSKGTGSAEDPIKIYTAKDLDSLRYYLGPEHANKHFRLMNDIDLTEFLKDSVNGWLPIAFSTEEDYFIFEGNSVLNKKERSVFRYSSLPLRLQTKTTSHDKGNTVFSNCKQTQQRNFQTIS